MEKENLMEAVYDLDFKNKLKIHNYLFVIFKCIAKKTTGQ